MPVEALSEKQKINFLPRQVVVEIGDRGGYVVFAIQDMFVDIFS